MKLLYISGTYCSVCGGAELSAHTLLKELSKSMAILVATDKVLLKKTNTHENYEGVPIFPIEHEQRISQLEKLVRECEPDCILTQLMWSDIALEIANRNKIPALLRICKIPFYLDITAGSAHSPTEIIAVSEDVKTYVRYNFGRDSTVIAPPIDMRYVLSDATNNYNNPFITMFNPIEKKGGGIFRELAKSMPTRQFATVPGWDVLKDKDEFDPEMIKRTCESLRIQYTGQRIKTLPFDDLKNVHSFSPTRNVCDIYAKTRILLVPSQWQETFARVAIEGMANGIPVIGSAVGGLQEHIREGGILIKDYANPEAWIQKILTLDDISTYQNSSLNGYNYVATKYSFREILDKFADLVWRVAPNGKY